MKKAMNDIQNIHVILGVKGESILAEIVHYRKWEVHEQVEFKAL